MKLNCSGCIKVNENKIEFITVKYYCKRKHIV